MLLCPSPLLDPRVTATWRHWVNLDPCLVVHVDLFPLVRGNLCPVVRGDEDLGCWWGSLFLVALRDL